MAKYTKFGVEFEFNSKYYVSEFIQKTKSPKAKIVNYYFSDSKSFDSSWKLKEDGSVYGDFDYGLELVSPILRDSPRGFEQVKLALQTVNKKRKNINVNETCGFHVHVNLGFAKKYSAVKLEAFMKYMLAEYAKKELQFDKRMEDGRRENNNEYCQSVIPRAYDYRSIDDIFDSSFHGGERYFKLNLDAYHQHGTVEFRHHHGTLNSRKALSWIKTCIKFVNTCRKNFEASWKKKMKASKKQDIFLLAA